MRSEGDFQGELIKELTDLYPGSFILKNDPTYIQGFPDLTILYNNKWATLECKKSKKENHQPNQDYYVDRCRQMSYSSFICPENKEEVLNELQQALRS